MQIVKFIADQSVHLPVNQQKVPIQHYLRQPHRLVQALVDPDRIQQVSDDEFCLTMRPLSFFGFNLQPTVYLQVWAEADGTVHLKSTNCEIRGVDYINQRFSLELLGKLSPQERQGETYLQGCADLQVQVALPPPLWFTPKQILEAAGNGLLKSVLVTVKQKLMHQLLSDYVKWSNTAQLQDNKTRSSLVTDF
jgi:Protein of unknown function (DUF1997)